MSLNVVIISGNLGANAELRITRGGTPVATMPVAVNDRVPAGDGTYTDRVSWIECTMFGKRAEGIAPYLTKGTKVAVRAHLRKRTWEHGGETRSSLDVIVDDVELMSVRRGSPAARPAADQAPPPAHDRTGAEVYDEDIPF